VVRGIIFLSEDQIGVEQLTYTVQRGAVARKLEFTARVAPVQQASPPFRAAS